MNVDRNSFLMLVTTLAAGGAVGYVAAEKRVIPAVDGWVGRVPEPGTEPARPVPVASVASVAPSMSAPPPPPPAPAAPTCDDTVATAVGECPGPGLPTIEGGCGSLATARCNELKQSLKPRVAAAAVDCIAKLNGAERCDANRIRLCGHLSLVNACPDTPSPAALAPDAAAAPASAATTICHGIIEACGASPIAPSMAECRQLLSGMTDTGREKTRTCMKAHCFDRGLIGCEAATAGK